MGNEGCILIQVVGKEGKLKVISLSSPIKVTPPSKEGGSGCISCSGGVVHFFAPDGCYEGWGITLGTPTPDADGWVGDFVQAVEESKKLEPTKFMETPKLD